MQLYAYPVIKKVFVASVAQEQRKLSATLDLLVFVSLDFKEYMQIAEYEDYLKKNNTKIEGD